MFIELESTFSRNGYPITMKTDNCQDLVLVEIENYLFSKANQYPKSPTYWPKSNREVER